MYLSMPSYLPETFFSSCPHIKYDHCQMHNMKPKATQSFLCWPLRNWFIVSYRRLKLVYWEKEKYLGSEYAFLPEERILYKLCEKYFKRGRLSFLPLSYCYSQSLNVSLFHIFPRGVLFKHVLKEIPVMEVLWQEKKKKSYKICASSQNQSFCAYSTPKYKENKLFQAFYINGDCSCTCRASKRKIILLSCHKTRWES